MKKFKMPALLLAVLAVETIINGMEEAIEDVIQQLREMGVVGKKCRSFLELRMTSEKKFHEKRGI
jgi:hypothetical protein